MTFKYLLAYQVCLDPETYCWLEYIGGSFDSPGEAYDCLMTLKPEDVRDKYYHQALSYSRDTESYTVDTDQFIIIARPTLND